MNNEIQFTNRFKSEPPKIGIRSVIDGRRMGLRGLLGNQTMQMAKTTAKFLEENLSYSNGMKVECVIPDICIGGVKKVVECAEKFKRNNIGVSITGTPCWCYGTVVMNTVVERSSLSSRCRSCFSNRGKFFQIACCKAIKYSNFSVI